MKKSEEAKKYLKENKKRLLEQFASLDKYPSTEKPFSIFMAGSPGAGKTETSKGLIESGLIEKLVSFKCDGGIVRIDDDEIRSFFGDIGYDGTNTDIFKSASNVGVEKIFDFSLNKKQNIILDNTFSNYKKSRDNVKRSLDKDRSVGIFYLYIDPIVAWNFTIKRSDEEGRSIPEDFFVESLFKAKDNVNQIKKEFGSQIELTLIERLYNNDKDVNRFEVKINLNIDSVDNHLKMKYTKQSLISKIC